MLLLIACSAVFIVQGLLACLTLDDARGFEMLFVEFGPLVGPASQVLCDVEG